MSNVARRASSFYARLLLGCWFMFLSIAAHASIVSLDTIYVSTVGGMPATGQGITVSSYIFVTSGSSLTLGGSGGYITTASSVTGSAYFGDGSHLAGTSPLSAANIFSGVNFFASSFTVESGGDRIVLSTSASVNNIAISSIGAISFFPSLHNSSSTIIPPAFNITTTSLGPCVGGSTLTITTSGGAVEVVFVGEISNPSEYPVTEISFLQDGNYVANLSSGTGIGEQFGDGQTPTNTMHFSYLLDPPAPGVHSYCITISAPFGGVANLLSDAGDIFYLFEIK